MTETTKVTLDDANKALNDIVEQRANAPEEPEPKPAAGEEKPEPEAEPEKEPEPEAEAAADDVESLKKRVSDLEAEQAAREKRHEARIEAMHARFKSNEEILRDRYVRKSGATERALKILREARTEAGVDPAEVDRIIREIEASMNPASASYAPPETGRAGPQATEDQAIVLNDFLNEKGMSVEDADQFGRWLRGDASAHLSPIEQAVAGRDLDGFLRIAHSRYIEVAKEKETTKKRNDAAEAVKTVQRTQREAARAASSSPAAPKKQPAAKSEGVDLKKLTRNDISDLLRQTVQNR